MAKKKNTDTDVTEETKEEPTTEQPEETGAAGEATAAAEAAGETTAAADAAGTETKETEPEAEDPNALFLVEKLAREQGCKSWELASLRHAAGWASGKSVTRAEFNEALNALRNRRLGSGRLKR